MISDVEEMMQVPYTTELFEEDGQSVDTLDAVLEEAGYRRAPLALQV